jgi:protein-disulfide isomerase
MRIHEGHTIDLSAAAWRAGLMAIVVATATCQAPATTDDVVLDAVRDQATRAESGSAPARRLQIGEALGSPDAPVLVLEFSDPGCFSCASFTRESFADLRAEFIDTGLVQWRTVLIDRGFPNGALASRVAGCAAQQGSFWEMRRELALHQREWIARRDAAQRFAGYAAGIHLEMPEFDSCLEQSATSGGMSTGEMVALQLGIRAVPVFMVGSQRVFGALSTSDFRAVIRRELER